jgi:IS605 OrfB family transposase
MITIKLPYKTSETGHLDYLKQWNNALRCSYNLKKKNLNLKETEISKTLKDNYSFDLLDASLIESAVNKSLQVQKDSDTLIFGGKKLWKSFCSGLVSKLEWKLLRNLPLQFKGRKNKSEKGNRKFRLDLIENNCVVFKPNRNNRFKLFLPNLNPKKRIELERLQLLAEAGKIALTIGIDHESVSISYEEIDTLPEDFTYDFIENRILSIDLNPNYLALVISGYDSAQAESIIHKEIISIKDLNDEEKEAFKDLRELPKGARKDKTDKLKVYFSNKRNHEVMEISKRVCRLAAHHQCESLVVEDLNMKSKNHGKGRGFNRLLNNQWNREKFVQNLSKRCNLSGIRFQKVAPQFSSFIGQIINPEDYDSIAAAIELGRRGNLFIRKFKKKEDIKDGIIYPDFDFNSDLINRWKEKLNLNKTFKSWVEFYYLLKNSAKSYRVFFRQSTYSGEFFRLNSNQSKINVFVL